MNEPQYSLPPRPSKLEAHLLKRQQAQINNEQLPTISANKNPDYEIDEMEKDLIHLRLSKRRHNPITESYDEFERIQGFSVSDFEQMNENNAWPQSGWQSVEIIHDPRPVEILHDPQ